MRSQDFPTIGITTFLRPDKCRDLIRSIRNFYPCADILIADNGRRLPAETSDLAEDFDGAQTFVLPYDCGLSAARNFLANSVRGDLLLCDDDFEFIAETQIELMIDVLNARPDVGFVCGSAGVTRPMLLGNGKVQRDPLTIERTPLGTQYQICDLADNFVLCSRAALADNLRWDPRLKIGEHHDFFWRVKRSRWKVAFVPSVRVQHYPGGSSEYSDLRNRSDDCKAHVRTMASRPIPAGQQMVAVLGPFRGGTSCVAGMLHRLGVPMGGELKAATKCNPRGFFEDNQLAKICRASYVEPWLPEQTDYRWRIEQLRHWACTRGPGIVGAKHPLLCLMVPEILEAWPAVKIVSVLRPVDCVEQSILDLGWGWDPHAVRTQIPRMIHERDAAIAATGAECLGLSYQTCIDTPDVACDLLSVFLGLDPTTEQRAAAESHPSRCLCHHRRAAD